MKLSLRNLHGPESTKKIRQKSKKKNENRQRPTMDLAWWIKYLLCTSDVAIELCKAHARTVCPPCPTVKNDTGEKSEAPEQTEHILPLGNFPSDRRIGSLELFIWKNTHGRSIWNQVGHILTERRTRQWEHLVHIWADEKPYCVADFPLINRKPLYQLFFTLIQN